MKRRLKIAPLIVLIANILLSNCTDLPRPERPNVPSGNLLLVPSSDFSTGSLSAVSLTDSSVYRDILPTHADAFVHNTSSHVYILNRLGSDSIIRLDPIAGFSLNYESSLGSGSNPSDIAIIDNDTAVIALYGRDYLSVIDPSNGIEKSRIDLSAYADGDGFPETSALYYNGSRLYVTLQRLNRQAGGSSVWPPVGTSYLLEINMTNRSIENAHTLPFTNPISNIRQYTGRNTLVFSAPGNFGANYSLDGGLIEFDPGTGSFRTSPLTESQAGYEIIDGLLVTDTLGFALCQDASFNSYLVAFNPATGSVSQTLASHNATAGGYFTGLVYTNSRIYIGDRNPSAPGIRIFHTNTLTEVTSKPLDTGLPPSSITLRN